MKISLESLAKGVKNLAKAGIVAGSLYLAGCGDNPTEPPKVTPPTPKASISQTVSLDNSVNIKYSANVKNLNGAKVDVSKDGSLILSRAINDSVYSETLSYSTNKEITKGNYSFALSGKTPSGKDTSLVAGLTIPNYSPDANFSGLQTDMNEGDSVNVNLEGKLTDTNPEDNPVSLTSAVSSDGKTQITMNGKNLNIKSLADKVGNYGVDVQIGSDAGGKSTKTLSGIIYDLLDVEGVLEDNELHSRQQGIIKVYTANNIKLGEIPVTNSGTFNRKFAVRNALLSTGIYIQGRRIESGEDKSYVRTMKLLGADQRNLTIRVVPYDGLAVNGVTPENFKRHAAEVLTIEKNNGTDPLTLNPIIYKWDFGEDPNAKNSFKEIVISKKDNDSTLNANFSQAQADNIKGRILDQNDIGAWFNGKINNPSQIRIVDSYDKISDTDYGRIFVYPSININNAYLDNDGFNNRLGIVCVDVNSNGELIDPILINHEFGHVSGLLGHAETLPQELTIMRSHLINVRGSPRFMDKKTAKVIYEDTYKQGQGTGANGLLSLNDILGLGFK